MAFPVALAMVASSIIGASSKSKQFKYKPYGPWLAMKDDVMKGIQQGIKEGGYTWSEAVGEKLQREAMLDISKTYEGAQRRAVENLIPYGNIGAAGRASQDVAIARSQQESSALRGLDVARETQKLSSLQTLLQLGSGMSDPNLPGAGPQFNRSIENPIAGIARGFEQGLAGWQYQNEADKERNFWQDYLNRSNQNQFSVSGSSPSIGFTGIPTITNSYGG